MRRLVLIVIVFLFARSVYGQIELVKDIHPQGSGIGGSELVIFNNDLYFSGRIDLSDRELYKSDGTASGTQIVANIRANGGSSPQQLTPAGNYLYFVAFDDQTKEELYRTDGTAAGTELVADLYPGFGDPDISNLTAVGDKLFFTGNDGVYGRELYVVEGTGIPTRLSDFASANSSAFFRDLVAYNGLLFFSVESDADMVGIELYVSDGTVGGTRLFKDLYPGEGNDGDPQNFSVIGDKLFFSANDEAGEEPWISDGTPEGTFRIADVRPGPADSNPHSFTGPNPGKVFFAGTGEGVFTELYITDGTETGTVLVRDINTEENRSSSPGNFTLVGENIYFDAFTSNTGKELYFSDGTPGGTYLVGDLNPGPDGADFITDGMVWYDSTFFFAADNGSTGIELWAVVNDTILDHPVQDLNPGSGHSRPQKFVIYKDSLFFFATGIEGRELRKMGPYDPCQGVACPVGQVCVDGTCIDPDPDPGPDDPCKGVQCPIGEVCYDGECAPPLGSSYGVVTDESTGLALENVFVYQLDGSDTLFSTYTDADGFYAITTFGNSFDLRFTKSGYASENVNLMFGLQIDSLNVSLSDDLCSGVQCPIGQICYEGSCYEVVQPYTGRVVDPSGGPMVGARVENPATGTSLFTNETGLFTVDPSWESVLVTKDGYSPRYQTLGSSKELVIFMQYDPCLSADCPEGFVCRGGECYLPGDTVFATIGAYSRDGSELTGIEVTELGTTNTFVLDGPTEIYLLTDRPHLVFLDTGNVYVTEILPFIAGQEMYFMHKHASCEEVNCPIGDICIEGVCYSPDELYEFSGYVMDNNSLALPYVTISSPWNTIIRSGDNGYFSINIPFQPDSLLLRFDKPDYGAVGQYIYPESDNFVVISPLDLCHGVACPIGQVCYQGSCYEIAVDNNEGACEGLACPPGQLCYEGGCYVPCYLDSTVCFNPEDPCDGVNCPIGQLCYEGSCYDPCVMEESSTDLSCSVYEDPCDAITVQPGYICQDGVLIPKCPENVLACAVSDPCGVIHCPPGQDCFQCSDATTGYNTSGTALIQGVLSAGLLKSGDDAQMQNQGVYLYLRDAQTGRNVAIARTDENGQFLFENLPAADYLLFVVLPGYFISEDEQLISVGEGMQLQLDITSRDAFLETDVTPLTALETSATGQYSKWYPSPNKGTHFYLDGAEHIEMVELFHISGKKILTQIDGGAGTTVELTTKQKLTPGFYIIRWKNAEDQFPKSQRLLVQ